MVRNSLSTLALLSTTVLSFGCVVYLDPMADAGNDDAGEDETAEADGETTGDEGDTFTSEPDTGDDSTDAYEDEGTDTDTGEDACVEAVDILFVIDNSGSMGEEQSHLVAAIPSMVTALDQSGLDWRIGVTTTDNGNVWCPAASTTPEAGRLVASSCKTRLGDFLFSDNVDVQDIACNDICSHTDIQTVSTVIDGVVHPAGPWVERVNGVANTVVMDGGNPVPLDPVEALSCILPQGVNGCGFESQLESMHLALLRANDANEAQFGFMREGAQLAVVFVSDETDCSSNKVWNEIFDPEGNKVFWSDPNSSFPTSAACWNAGMVCTGDPSGYDDCVATNKDIDGSHLPPGDDPDAVLHPIERYTETLAAIEDAKQQLDPSADVMVFGVVGVQSDGSLLFADVGDTDPAFQDSFGIGPGCTGEGGISAVPPGRMREVIEEFDGTMHSICNTQYIDAFQTIANRLTVGCGE
jgi:hypothetical protein